MPVVQVWSHTHTNFDLFEPVSQDSCSFLESLELPSKLQVILSTRAVDPHSFYADPDPAVFLNADPDPDPGPGPA